MIKTSNADSSVRSFARSSDLAAGCSFSPVHVEMVEAQPGASTTPHDQLRLTANLSDQTAQQIDKIRRLMAGEWPSETTAHARGHRRIQSGGLSGASLRSSQDSKRTRPLDRLSLRSSASSQTISPRQRERPRLATALKRRQVTPYGRLVARATEGGSSNKTPSHRPNVGGQSAPFQRPGTVRLSNATQRSESLSKSFASAARATSVSRRTAQQPGLRDIFDPPVVPAGDPGVSRGPGHTTQQPQSSVRPSTNLQRSLGSPQEGLRRVVSREEPGNAPQGGPPTKHPHDIRTMTLHHNKLTLTRTHNRLVHKKVKQTTTPTIAL